jgi:hypothetical protein
MPITPVDYNPFAAQYGEPNRYTDPRRRQPPQTPQVSTMPAPGLEEPQPFNDPEITQSRQRMDADPGVRTARGLVRRGEEATQDRLFQDLRSRFINNPQALSMLKYLEAQQRYGDQTLKTLKAAQLRPAQPMDTLPADQSSVARPGEYQQAQMPAQRMQPAQQPGSGIPRQQNYQAMRPRPGMVVNGYRLVNPAKPNDRASWQPVTEK